LRALPLEWDFIEGGIGYAEYQRSRLAVARRNPAKDFAVQMRLYSVQ
jgi:hypothetical protein